MIICIFLYLIFIIHNNDLTSINVNVNSNTGLLHFTNPLSNTDTDINFAGETVHVADYTLMYNDSTLLTTKKDMGIHHTYRYIDATNVVGYRGYDKYKLIQGLTTAQSYRIWCEAGDYLWGRGSAQITISIDGDTTKYPTGMTNARNAPGLVTYYYNNVYLYLALYQANTAGVYSVKAGTGLASGLILSPVQYKYNSPRVYEGRIFYGEGTGTSSHPAGSNVDCICEVGDYILVSDTGGIYINNVVCNASTTAPGLDIVQWVNTSGSGVGTLAYSVMKSQYYTINMPANVTWYMLVPDRIGPDDD